MIPLLILLQTALHAYTILDSKLQTQNILSIWDNDHTDQADTNRVADIDLQLLFIDFESLIQTISIYNNLTGVI